MRYAVCFVGALALLACQNNPSAKGIDPRLIAEAEAFVKPNTDNFVSDGELVHGIYFVVENGYGYPRSDPSPSVYPPPIGSSNPYGYLFIDPSPIVTLGNFTRIFTEDAIDGGREVHVVMDEVGSARWLVATRLARDQKLAIVIGDSVVCTPMVTGEVSNGRTAINLGNSMSASEVEAFAERLNLEKKDVPPAH